MWMPKVTVVREFFPVKMEAYPSRSASDFRFQKRDFSLGSVAPGKTFTNPNFVVPHYPYIHHDNNFMPSINEKISQFDISGSNPESSTNSAPVNSNSSESLINTLKEHHLSPAKSSDSNSKVDEEPKSKMCKKQSRRNRKRKQKKSSKQDNPINLIKDMMDVDLEVDTEESSDISISPKVSRTLHLTDFLVQKETDTFTEEEIEDLPQEEDDEECLATFVSISPSNISKINIRERQISVAESEDSFIIFEAGTTEEPESSEESGSESSDEDEWEFEDEEEDEEDGCDEVDFAFPVIPTKKVRFAEDSELCEIHTMVQWSFAYQQARKGQWEEYARDRDRFSRRLIEMENILKPVFEPSHREKVFRQRFTDDTDSPFEMIM